MYKTLVTKVNAIDTSKFVLKSKFDTEKSDFEKKITDTEKKIPDASGLVKKTDYNAKPTEIVGKIPSISGLVNNAALTSVENKIPNVSILVKKQIIAQRLVKLKRKLDHVHDKYITISEFDKLKTENFAQTFCTFCTKVSTNKFSNKDRF